MASFLSLFFLFVCVFVLLRSCFSVLLKSPHERLNLSLQERILSSAATLTGTPSSASTSGARAVASGREKAEMESAPVLLAEAGVAAAAAAAPAELLPLLLGGRAWASAQQASMAARACARALAPGPPREPATGGSGLPRSAAGAK